MLNFKWNVEKARVNLRKHGVSFEEAATIFNDPRAITIHDPDHSTDEYREISIGVSIRLRIVVVSHTDRDGAIRIISARKASAFEISRYEEE